MIGRLKGKVVTESPDGLAVIDVHGVGYEVMLPLGTLGRVARDEGDQVTLQIHTHVREDAIVLFGFSDERERTAFRLLTNVDGVGPRIAISILGVLPAAELAATVARADTKRLQTVPGVGKRIAERLALELKDKLASGVLSSGVSAANVSGAYPASSAASAVPPRAMGPMGMLVTTLVQLGFKPVEAERAAAELKDREAEPLDALVRDALRLLRP